MRPYQRSLGAIVRINLSLLGAVLAGVIAWVSWPSSPHWWGLGVLSIILWVAALQALMNAIRGMVGLYERDRAMADYLALGGAPKSARPVSDEELAKLGMSDG